METKISRENLKSSTDLCIDTYTISVGNALICSFIIRNVLHRTLLDLYSNTEPSKEV